MNKITFLFFTFLFISVSPLVFSQNCPPNLSTDPAEGDFGTNEWLAYVYNHNSYNTSTFNLTDYRGYYRDSGYGDSGISFDSSDLWNIDSNPSTAPAYEGCSVTSDNHTVVYKRKGFPLGEYRIDIASQTGGNGHDDAAILYIDGLEVWNNTGCCAPRLNVWSGSLDEESEIEFVWSERSGGSYGRLRLTEVTLDPPLGNEGDFGDEEWFVSAYNGSNFDAYRGAYIHDALSFNTRDLWLQSVSPSSAPNYSGDQVNNNNHSFVYRRRGFSCGIYQLNIPSHDDNVIVTIDGVEIFTSGYVGGNRIDDIWQGYLGPNSEIEYSIVEFSGQSYGSLQFVNISESNQFIWTGEVNTSVDNVSNWCGSLPLNDGTSNIYIPANVNNFPNSNFNSFINDIYIEPNASLTFDSEIRIAGNLVNDGMLSGEDGSLNFVGPQNHVVNGNGFSISNLTIDSDLTFDLDLGEIINLSDILSVDQGTLNTNGNLSLRCNFGTPGKTAQVGPVGGTIVGDVTVEQCYPARRAFRFLSSSVTTATSIRENWQENPVGYKDNPRPGYGTHITGVSPGSANAIEGQDGNNGFDYSPSGNASMFTFDNATPSWDRVTNTNGVLTAGEAYRLFLRGDRSIDITLNGAPPTATRLSATGVLAIGGQPVTNLSGDAGAFNFIGNPYQAQVDINVFLTNSTNLSETEYYVWDPTLGGSPTPGSQGGRGAYVTVQLPAGTNSFTPSGSNKGSNANQYLQPMQAAFVTTTGAAASMTFEESYKAVGEIQTDVKSNSVQEYINIQLFDANSFAEGATPSDGLRINFDKSFSISTEDDSPKLGNLDENLARVEGNAFSAIERRPLPEATEELPLFINQYRRESYVMKFDVTDNLNTKVYVEDKYLNQTQEITASANTYAFTVDNSIPESKASDRFSLFFQPVSLSNPEENISNLSLYPNPTRGNFSITGMDLGQGGEVEIYNMIGQQVFKRSLSGESTIEVTDFNANAGIYLVKLKTNQGERTFKLIKE
jgi:hypothetical protein